MFAKNLGTSVVESEKAWATQDVMKKWINETCSSFKGVFKRLINLEFYEYTELKK